jgi:hypothetical protein
MVGLFLIGTSVVINPIKVKTSVPPEEGTFKEYLPSESVTVPVRVPFSTTFTPGMADPSSADVTFPVMVLSCKGKKPHSAIVRSENIKIGFIKNI